MISRGDVPPGGVSVFTVCGSASGADYAVSRAGVATFLVVLVVLSSSAMESSER
jgi:hypothetical protein